MYKPKRGRPKLSLLEWPKNFDTRHGDGSYQRLLALFEDPRTLTYKEIADKGFCGVTKECVAQWHNRIFPDGPTGLERRHLHTLSNARQELFSSDSYKTFHRIARQHFPEESIEPIYLRGPLRFRAKAVKLDGKKVLLKRGYRNKALEKLYAAGTMIYSLINSSENADYLFFLLEDNDFLFIPKGILPKRTSFQDSETSQYYQYKNNFDALKEVAA